MPICHLENCMSAYRILTKYGCDVIGTKGMHTVHMIGTLYEITLYVPLDKSSWSRNSQGTRVIGVFRVCVCGRLCSGLNNDRQAPTTHSTQHTHTTHSFIPANSALAVVVFVAAVSSV